MTAASHAIASRDVAAQKPGAALPSSRAARGALPGSNPAHLVADMLPLTDGLMVLAASAVAYLLRIGTEEAAQPEIAAVTLLAAILCVNVLHAGGAYRELLSDGVIAQIGRVARAWCGIAMGLVLVGYLTKSSHTFSRAWALSSFLLALAGLIALRIAMSLLVQRWRRSGRLARTVAVVDLSGRGQALAQRLAAHGPQDVRMLGVYRDGPAADGGADITALIALSRATRIDEIMVIPARTNETGEDNEETRAVDTAVQRLGTIPAHLHLCPELPSVAIAPRAVAMLFDTPVLTLRQRPLPGWHAVSKRMEDLVLGTLLLLLVAPVMAVIAVLVRLDSPGPVLFRQRRLGFNNNEFVVFKFRTMVQRPDEPDVPQAQRNDPRVTRLGRFLRSKSLDELPQVFNVLRGDMSLVGPRPHALAHNDKYSELIDGYLGRHRVRPGITGWAQVNGYRGETDTLEKMQRRVEYDLAYIDSWSVAFDLRILMQTALCAMFDRNAF